MSNKAFEPTNDKNTFYLYCGNCTSNSYNFEEILYRARKHFGEDTQIWELEITPEYIHTEHITYDLYDPADWSYYLVIEKKSNG